MPYIGNKYEIGDHNNSWKTLDDISSYVATFDGSATNAVSTTNNTIRVPEHRFIQGQRVTYSNGGGGNIGGLTSGTAYYIIHDTNNEFKLATSLANANASTAINLSAVGSGTSHTVTAAFDGVNKKFKITYSGGRSSRFTSATQLSVAINNILQRPNDTTTFTDGFRISDNEKIEFNVAPVAADIFWGSILSASLPTFDISDNKLDNFTGDGSTTDFTLSHIPVNNEGIIVTINGVIQHPTDKNGTRAYSLDASILVFTAAPANGDEIQVRHIGFAGASSSSVTGFYGRTGNVTLSSSADNAIVGVITATKFSGPFVGTITGGNDIVAGIITANAADIDDWIDVGNNIQLGNAGVITATTFRGDGDFVELDVDGHTNLDNVSIAGVTTFSEDVKFTGATSGRDILWDKSDNQLEVKNNSKIVFGNSNELSIYHDGSDSRISNGGGLTYILGDVIRFRNHGDSGTLFNAALSGVDLYASTAVKLSTTNTGVNITGICTATDFSGAAGGAADFPNGLTGTTATFSGNVTVGGVLTYEDVTNIDSVGIVTARNGLKVLGGGADIIGQTTIAHTGYPQLILKDSDSNSPSDTNGISLRSANNTEYGFIGQTESGGHSLFIKTVATTNPIRLQVNSTTRFEVGNTGGYVTGLLDVTGNVSVGDTLYVPDKIIHKGGDNDTAIRFPANDNISFETAGGQRLLIGDDGQITQTGASGDSILHIKRSNTNTTGVTGAIDFVASDDHSVASIQARGDGDNEGAHLQFYTTTAAAGDMFNAANIERLRIKSDGVVNIGDRSDNTWIDSTLKVRKDQNAVTKIAVRNENQGSSASSAIAVNAYGNSWMFDCGSAAKNSNALTIRVDATAGGNQGTEKLRIQTDGKVLVGAGCTNASLLNVKGSAGFADDGTNAGLIISTDDANGAALSCLTTGGFVNGAYGNMRFNALSHKFTYGNTTRLEINSSGKATFTGDIATAQDYPTIKPTLDLNFVSNKVLDPRFEYYRYGPASYIDENGKVVLVGEDVPRFDHDPDTRECKGLLIEGERTNLFPNGVRPGDKFNHSKAGTFTENTTETTAPDGSYTATKWTFTNNDPYLYHNQTLLAGVTYTMSMWVKAGTNMAGDWLQFRIGGGPYSPQADSIIPADGTWRRITHTRTIGGSNESGANIGFEPQTSPSGNPSSGDVIYIWGAQLESGSTASSFIPTYGYTQTRGPDKLQITGKEFTDFYNQTEGTIFLSASYETDARNVANVTFDDISNESEYTDVGYRAGGGSSGKVASYVRTDSGGDQYFKQYASAATQGNEFKVALAYKDNDYASSANGQTVDTDTSGTTSKVYDRLRFSDVHNVGLGGVGHYRRLMYYSKRITNTQLVTLTS